MTKIRLYDKLFLDTKRCFYFELKTDTLKVGDKMNKLAKFYVGVKKEMKRVKWLNGKNLTKYSVATISFILIFMAFFALSDAVLSIARMVIGG